MKSEKGIFSGVTAYAAKGGVDCKKHPGVNAGSGKGGLLQYNAIGEKRRGGCRAHLSREVRSANRKNLSWWAKTRL